MWLSTFKLIAQWCLEVSFYVNWARKRIILKLSFLPIFFTFARLLFLETLFVHYYIDFKTWHCEASSLRMLTFLGVFRDFDNKTPHLTSTAQPTRLLR